MRALVREIPDSFVRALAKTPAAIDVALAREQHAAYRAALVAGGGEVIVVPADEACPDCVFVEDTAVIVGKRALITRPGAPSRRAETAPIAMTLERRGLEVIEMAAPATLDGGDVLVVDEDVFVGRSQRTNDAGIEALRRAFGELTVIELPSDVLHLKCVVSRLDDDTIALADDTIPWEQLGLRAVRIPRAELYAANVVALPRHVVVAEGYPRTHEALDAAGYRLAPVPVSEVRKADGSLTCQSLLWG